MKAIKTIILIVIVWLIIFWLIAIAVAPPENEKPVLRVENNCIDTKCSNHHGKEPKKHKKVKPVEDFEWVLK